MEIKSSAEMALEKVNNTKKNFSELEADNQIKQASKTVVAKNGQEPAGKQVLSEPNAIVLNSPEISIKTRLSMQNQLFKWHIPENLKDAIHLLEMVKLIITKKINKQDRSLFHKLWVRLFGKYSVWNEILKNKTEMELELKYKLNGECKIPTDLNEALYLCKILETEINRQVMLLLHPIADKSESNLSINTINETRKFLNKRGK